MIEDMENEMKSIGRIEEAVAGKRSGRFNCAQAVACAFADIVGMDVAVVERLTGAFGTGMGCMEGTCGALVGAGFIVGAVSPDRVSAMKSMRGIVSAFNAKNGATICKILKGIETGKPLRACDGCVEDAATLLQDFLRENVTNR